MTAQNYRKQDHTLPKFEVMISHNVFIKNNLYLKKMEILPSWVEWIQFGKPTKRQLCGYPDTLANFRMLTHDGQFLVCGNVRANKEDIIVGSWTNKFIAKINSQLGKQGTSVTIVPLSIETYAVVRSAGVLMRGAMDRSMNDEYRPREVGIDIELDHDLALQSFFWKAEHGETPPEIDVPVYSKNAITTAFTEV